MQLWLPVLVAVIGLIILALAGEGAPLSRNGKIADVGKILFAVGVLFTLATLAGRTVLH